MHAAERFLKRSGTHKCKQNKDLSKRDAIPGRSSTQDHCRRDVRELGDVLDFAILCTLPSRGLFLRLMNKLSLSRRLLHELAILRRAPFAACRRLGRPRRQGVDQKFVRPEVFGHEPLAIRRGFGHRGGLSPQAIQNFAAE
jgi:hypothetical protein